MTFIKTTLMAVGACVTLAAPASANPANVERVTEGLIAAGIAVELGDQCGSVSVRRLRGINFLFGLKRHLEDLGYSNAEIDAYIDNRTEKASLETIAQQRLNALGARSGDEETYCTVARTQIAQDTQIGRLLR